MWKLHPPPKKSHPPLSQQHPSESWGVFKPPLLKIWLEAQPPSPVEMGVQTMTCSDIYISFSKIL